MAHRKFFPTVQPTLNVDKAGNGCGSFFRTAGDAQTIISHLRITERRGKQESMLRHLPIPQALANLSLLELSDVSGSAVSLLRTLPWLPDTRGHGYGFATAALRMVFLGL